MSSHTTDEIALRASCCFQHAASNICRHVVSFQTPFIRRCTCNLPEQTQLRWSHRGMFKLMHAPFRKGPDRGSSRSTVPKHSRVSARCSDYCNRVPAKCTHHVNEYRFYPTVNSTADDFTKTGIAEQQGILNRDAMLKDEMEPIPSN